MITCNRCGNVAPAGAVHCQRCGAPLSGKVENNYGPRMGNQNQSAQGGQPELPAWLESLRAGERPVAPPKSPSNFSASDLIEEGSLPGWMRSEQGEGNTNAPTGPQPSLRSSSLPGPNTDEGTSGAKGFTARSLIDEQALPSWMKEGSDKSGTPSGGLGSDNIAASSLVQPDALPDWMKNLQQSPTSRARSSQPLSPGYGNPSGALASGALPGQPVQTAQPKQPAAPAQPIPPTPSPLPPTQSEPLSVPKGFSARDLIDQSALPSWMAPQGGTEDGATIDKASGIPGVPGSPATQGGPSTGQKGFSASSLLDMDSLPPWLRESGQQPDTGGNSREPQSGAFSMPAQQNMPWQAATPAQANQGAPLNNAQGQAAAGSGGGIAASSFIDMNALPEWLRSGVEPQQGKAPSQGAMGATPPGSYGGPQRVENVRVPSRPRGEINQQEGSEVAANVFASMLGVASAAPNFPASSPMPSAPSGSPMPAAPQAAPGFPMPPAAQSVPGSPMPSAQAGPPPLSPAQPGSASMTSGPLGGSMPPQGMAPGSNSMTAQPGTGNLQPPQGYLGVYGGAYPGNQNNQNNYAMGNPPMGSPQIPPGSPGMPQVPAAAGLTNGEQPGVRPAKRGLFNAIRDWLFR